MERGTSILVAGGVLATGILLSMQFQRPSPDGLPPSSGSDNQLVVRNCTPDAIQSEEPRRREARGADLPYPGPIAPSRREAVVLAPADAGDPPPLAKSYPRPQTPTASWGRPMVMLPQTSQETPKTHKIVDGDTLGALAERYLGSAERSGEILQANRDVLVNSEILPIGAELKIPPR